MADASITNTAGDAPSDALISDVFERDCTSRAALDDIASKWGPIVLLALIDGEHRFNALRRRVAGVSEKMLSQTLQAFERDGLVHREMITAVPPHVEYTLTEFGRDAAGHLRDLAELLEGSAGAIEAARRRFDATPLSARNAVGRAPEAMRTA